jgi:DNA-binding transcriptional regulator YiaG
MVLRYDQRTAEFAKENSGIHASGHSRNHKDTPALPFCHFKIKAEKPRDFDYPTEIKTLGDQLRAKRLDLGLSQKEVADLLNVSEDSVCYWENDSVRPSAFNLNQIRIFVDGARCRIPSRSLERNGVV